MLKINNGYMPISLNIHALIVVVLMYAVWSSIMCVARNLPV